MYYVVRICRYNGMSVVRFDTLFENDQRFCRGEVKRGGLIPVTNDNPFPVGAITPSLFAKRRTPFSYFEFSTLQGQSALLCLVDFRASRYANKKG